MNKLPPKATEIEESILAAAMIERNALMAVVDLLNPEDFYSETNAILWETIRNLFNTDHAVDLRTIVNALKKSGKLEKIGGMSAVAEISAKASSAANIEYHARILIESSIKRSLITTAAEVNRDCYEDTSDVFELLDRVQSKFDKISSSYFKNNAIDAATLYRQTIDNIVKKRNDDGITGIPTGFSELDRITGGWQSPNLVIIAARPGMGKTVVGVSCAVSAALNYKKPVAIFSLEMSSMELMNRMIAAESEIDLEKIIRGSTTPEELNQIGNKSAKLLKAPIYVDDTPALSILELRAKCRRLKHEHKIELIVVDYLQLMKGERSGNREQEIASISSGLKGIAKELSIPVIALSQLSRAVEQRGGDKRPQLSDLRESGSLEQDADVVMFLYRPEYYKIMTDETGASTMGLVEVITAKNRNGKVGGVQLQFVGKYAKIIDLQRIKPLPTDWSQPKF
jgi:replicative DNA helicase